MGRRAAIRKVCRRAKLVLPALVVVVLLVVAGCGLIKIPPVPATATGFFHMEQHDGRPWMVSPDGRPFYSHGVNHVTPSPNTDRVTHRCPYCEAIAAKYPDVAAWSDSVVSRLRGWGFNTIGAFSTVDTFSTRMPYTLILGMAGGNDWFSPDFETRAANIAAQKVAPRRDDPNLVGWFLDNELHWGPDYLKNETLLTTYLSLPEGSPGRMVADSHIGDPGGFLRELADRYYSVTTQAIRAADPNHMILGTRLVSFLSPVEVVEEAANYLDVLSVNHYTLIPGQLEGIQAYFGPDEMPVDANLSEFHRRSGLPVMIGEYSFRAADAGVPNSYPPIYLTAATQTERAASYASYVARLYLAPWIVGDHWFEWADQPPGGRGDGEDNNFGLVSNNDDNYTLLTDRMTEMHKLSPDRSDPRPLCGSWERTGSPPTVTCTAPLGDP